MYRFCKYCNCQFETVNKRIYCNDFCSKKHFQYARKHKDPEKYILYLKSQNKKPRDAVRIRLGLSLDHPQINESGKGFKIKDGYKYILCKDHPNAAKSGYIAEHVLFMSNFIERPLFKKETVHHKNGIRNDNRIENLELWSNSHPYGQRVEDKINWCKEFLEQYGYKVIMGNQQSGQQMPQYGQQMAQQQAM